MGGLNFLIKCNYDTKYLKWIPKFYRNLLDYILEIYYNQDCECIIWNNRHILIEGKSIFWRDWYEKGIIHMHDFINSTGDWLTFDEFCNKFEIRTNFLRYLGILSAIKQAARILDVDFSRKPTLDIKNLNLRLYSGKMVNIEKAKSKDFYSEFVELTLEPPISCRKWLENYSLNEDIFYESLPLVKKCTSETKLLATQFKIIHNITNCKSNLYKWEISNSDLCDFCATAKKDDLFHSLGECESTNHFLSNVFSRLDPQKSFCKDIALEEFVFGVEKPALNTIFLVIKKYILNVRTYKLNYSVDYVLQEIFRRIILDMRRLKRCTFLNKWQNYQRLIDQATLYWEENTYILI